MIGSPRIRWQILFVAVVPVLLIAALLVGYFIQTRLTEAELSLRERIHARAESLAITSEYALFSGNVEHLQTHGMLHSLSGNTEELEYGVLRDRTGQVVASWGRGDSVHFALDTVPSNEGWQFDEAHRSLVYHHPVIINLAEAGEPLAIESAPHGPESEPLGWVSLQYSLEPLNRKRDEIIAGSLLITLGGLLVGGLLAFRMSGNLGARIDHLAETVRRLGRGELGTRAERRSRGELGVLEQGINQMASALERSHLRMQEEIDSATQQLRESLRSLAVQESRYRELVQSANSIILKHDLDGTITFFNEFAESFFGYSSTAMTGRNIFGSLLEGEPEELQSQIDSWDGISTLGRHRDRDGRTLYVNWSLRRLEDERTGHAEMIAVGNDVTQQHRISKAIGLLSEAGSSGRDVYEDIAHVLQTGLDCRWVGIIGGCGGMSPPRLLATLGRDATDRFGRLATTESLLRELADCREPRTLNSDAIKDHPRLATCFGDHLSALRTSPAVDDNGEVIGSIFVANDQPLDEHRLIDNLLRLTAKRLALELRRSADARMITEARDEALAATQAKSRFLANVSHEIRTPMNGIVGFGNLLLREPLSPRQHGQVEMILQSARSLLTVINDILDISKIEAGKMTVTVAPLRIVETVEELLAIFAVQAHQKGLEISHEFADDLPLDVVSDKQRLVQVLTNLIGNAIKFTDRGTVSLKVWCEHDAEGDEWLRFDIDDSGIGISDDDRTRLFDAFSQVDSTTSRRHSGTGLGLAITKQLVDLLGGTVGVVSHPGSGSRFWFTVPLQRASTELLGAAVGDLLCGQHVLLYEPEPTTRKAAASILVQAGARVDTAGDDARLETLLAGSRYALVILGQPPREDVDTLCQKRIPHVMERHTGKLLVLTRDTIDCGIPENCVGCVRWCVPKPLSFATLRGGSATATAGVVVPPPVHASAAAAAVTERFSGCRVLVADDSAVNRQLIVTLLEEAGVHVTEAPDGREAVRLATAAPFDMILMDLQMPRVSGREAADLLHVSLGARCPPIIALTADAFPADGDDGTFDARLIKPLDETLLWKTLERHLSRHDSPIQVPRRDDARAAQVSGGNAQLERRLLELFLAEIPEHREALRDAAGRDDRSALRATVHKLRGSADYCAFAYLSEAAGALESALDGDEKDVTQLHEALLGQLSAAEREARDVITETATP